MRILSYRKGNAIVRKYENAKLSKALHSCVLGASSATGAIGTITKDSKLAITSGAVAINEIFWVTQAKKVMQKIAPEYNAIVARAKKIYK